MWTQSEIWNGIINFGIGFVASLAAAVFYSFVRRCIQKNSKINEVGPTPDGGKGAVASVTSTPTRSPVLFDMIPRTRELADIKKYIAKNEKTVVHGMGGTGKTEICRELYAQCLAGKIKSVKKVGWIGYDGDLKSSFLNKFPKVGLKSKKPDEYYAKVKSYLNGLGSEMLLFVDHFNTDEDSEIEYLNSLLCRVILISRHKIDDMKPVNIDKLSKVECYKLYKKHNGGLRAPDEVLDEIIELADSHTLAVELLAKTQNKSGWTAEELLGILTRSGFASPEIKEVVKHEKTDQRFIEHFAVAFDIADFEKDTVDAEKAEKLSEELHVLRLIALLANEPVAKTDLKAWFAMQNLNPVNRLVKKGWLSETSQGERSVVEMHPIISAVVRYKKQPDLKTAEPFVATLVAKLRLNPTEVLTHARSVANCFKAETDSDELARLFHILTRIYEDQGDLEEALEWHGPVLRYDHKVWGPNHPHSLRSRDNAEAAYAKSGREEPFESWLLKTLTGE